MKIIFHFNIFLIFTLVFTCVKNANSNETSASALSSQEVENSDLRKGFQFVYLVANSFIDAIKINYPNEIFSSNTTIKSFKELEENFLAYLNTSDWKDYFDKVNKKFVSLFFKYPVIDPNLLKN